MVKANDDDCDHFGLGRESAREPRHHCRSENNVDRIQSIQAFLTVVETGGFAPAARRLRVSSSVITRAVSHLEQRLGVSLLMRTTRVVRVTEAGARYALDCRRILSELDEADDAASGTRGIPRGQLTVTASVLFGRMVVTPLVIDYLTRYPEADVSCWFLDRVVNLVEEGVDVALRIGELPDSSLKAVRVGQVRRVVCASPGYLARCGTPQSPAELAAHTVVAASGVSPTPEWKFNDDGRSLAVRLHARMTTTTNDSAIAAALAGFGLTRLMSYQVAQHLRDGELIAVLTEFEGAALPVHLVHRDGRHATPKLRAFIELARETLAANHALSS